MLSLYRNPFSLPSLVLVLPLPACEDNPPPTRVAGPISDKYLDALQEGEALKHSLDERIRERQHLGPVNTI